MDPLERALAEHKAVHMEPGTTIDRAGLADGVAVGSPGTWPMMPAVQMFPVDPPFVVTESGWYRVDVVDGVPSIELLRADE